MDHRPALLSSAAALVDDWWRDPLAHPFSDLAYTFQFGANRNICPVTYLRFSA